MESGVTVCNLPAPGIGKDAGVRQRECLRCGKCCKESSPTLVEKDLSILPSENIGFSHIYTIRKGELKTAPHLLKYFL